MELKGSVALTYVNVILKFGYDHLNISYRNVPLENISNLSKFRDHMWQSKIKWSYFTLNGETSSKNLKVVLM